ncbi:hypothetical protein GCM10020256_37060 [Streptomyces thermocoprophilus]
MAHPFLFTVEYALAALLRHRGVTPDVLIGYSLGEYVAACLAGVFTLEDALRIVVERARLIEAAEPGHMLAVSVDETRVRAALAACGASVDVAALNGPQMTVLSGRPDEIETVRRHLDAGGVACRLLRSAHAFHSTLLEPARDKLQALIASVPRDAPAVTIVSNLTGRRLTAEQAVDPAYWAEHLCRPVRFADGVAEIGRLGVDACVELGAGQTLGGLVRQNGGERAPAVFGTLPAPWPAQNRKDERLALLETCGRLWEVGVDLAWPALREPGAALTDLPRYPFQRTRFWPEPPAAGTADPLQETGSAPADLCYAPAWQQDIAPGILPPALDGPLLILDSTAVPGPAAHGTSTPDAAGTPGAALAALAAASGTPVLHVVPGTGDLRHDGPRTTADPARPEHLREVLRTASALGTGPLHIAHLGGLATRGPDGDGEEAALRAAITGGFDTLLRTVRALAELPADRPVRLLTVSAGAVEVTGGDISAPERSLVHGLGRVVRSEHPALAWRGVDLEADPQGAVPDAGAAARALGHELRRGPWTDDGDALTAHRGGRRWLRGFSPVEPADSAAPIWRPDGTYLITGGTRGLGMALARHLVRSGVRRLALLGRTPLSDDGGPAAHRTLADVAELEAAGAEVLLLTADAGEPEQLREALRRCREHFGALHGVVHCAGVPAGGMAARRTPEEAARVLAPKVLAMAPLAELAGPGVPEEERLELLVLYSSSVTVLGGIGEGDYCAANTVLDAYAARLARSAPGTRVLSVAWSPWQHDDWGRDAQDALAGRVRAYRREYGFTDEAGCAFLDRLAAGAQGPVLALRQPLEEARRVWASLSAADAQAAPAAPVGTARFPRPQLRSAYVAPATGLESTIAEVWCAYLGLEQVGAHDPFFELGGNSLIGMSMVAALEKRLGRPVAPRPAVRAPDRRRDGRGPGRGHRRRTGQPQALRRPDGAPPGRPSAPAVPPPAADGTTPSTTTPTSTRPAPGRSRARRTRRARRTNGAGDEPDRSGGRRSDGRRCRPEPRPVRLRGGPRRQGRGDPRRGPRHHRPQLPDERPDGRARAGRGRDPRADHHRGRCPRGRQGVRGDRERHRELGDQAAGPPGDRRGVRPGHRGRRQHLRHPDHPDRLAEQPPRAHGRRPLHEPGAGEAGRRADPRRAHLAGDRAPHP